MPVEMGIRMVCLLNRYLAEVCLITMLQMFETLAAEVSDSCLALSKQICVRKTLFLPHCLLIFSTFGKKFMSDFSWNFSLFYILLCSPLLDV